MIADHRFALVAVCLLAPVPARADGPADNVPDQVRPVPKPGIAITPEVRSELQAGLDDLQARIASLPPTSAAQRADVLVFHKAVHDALVYQEFFADRDVAAARELLRLGRDRTEAIRAGDLSWATRPGLVVRGYLSKIDGSVQPYGLVIPPSYRPEGPGKYRLDIWFHGRGETLSEVNFLDQRRKQVGEFAPADTIVLHPYGRYCNASKFAGEIDVLEALEAVENGYRVDPDRIAVRGFSMGGAACWHFAVHYPDRWFAANPGAGFAETPRFLDVFQKEKLQPSWFEQKLWRLYDCTEVAVNLAGCPTVAYSGSKDTQKQAADVMTQALEKENIELVHVIGEGAAHVYEAKAKAEVVERLASLAEAGRQRFPREVHFATYTLRYNRSSWVTIDRLDEHWEKARVDAEILPDGAVWVMTDNVAEFTLSFPPGFAPFPLTKPVRVTVHGETFEADPPRSDRSWEASFFSRGKRWQEGRLDLDRAHKVHGLQGPIDDAFMDAFVFVKPTGKSRHPKFQAWVEAELARAITEWRRHFRGEVRIVNDTDLKDDDPPEANLIVWGDADSNSFLKRWDKPDDPNVIKVGKQTFDAAHHAFLAIHPCPVNHERYMVVNSGFTFREYDYLNNARQTPKLPDWAVIDLDTPPNSRWPGKVVAAGFYDEFWMIKDHENQQVANPEPIQPPHPRTSP